MKPIQLALALTGLAAAGLVTAGLARPAHAAEPVVAWQGARSAVTVDQLRPTMGSGEGYGEKYTFNADFGERGSLYYSLTVSNLGFGDHKMEAKGRLTLDGEKYTWKKQLDDDDWSFSKSGEFKISAGPATLSGTPDHLVLEALSGKNALKFDFKAIAQPWRPRNGQVQFGSDRKKSDYTVFPLMTVSGTVFADGKLQTVEGKGHGTHSWTELALYDQARWSMEFRGVDLGDDTTLYIRELGLHRDYGAGRVAYLLVTRGKEILVESFDYQLTPTDVMTDGEHENRYQVPESFTLLGNDAEAPQARQFRGKITKKKLLRRKDLLSTMNAAVRMVVSKVSKPVTYQYDSEYLLEVRIDGQVQRLQGVGRYEMTHFNK
ncbi:MAG: hypothetical protein KC613_13625 [Myxococcales bacterium]|nr:hypothetical protein [Myxococcales bacterium]MCB9524223.1 hypothetical protein [Myxococcales bacterium]